ncbi:hypothetical protein ACHAWC_005291, partial [Mediolabrus comicus]
MAPMEDRLAPLGGFLDALLARVAAVEEQLSTSEKEALISAAALPPQQQQSTNDDNDIIAALNSEILSLREQLATSEKQRQRLERQLTSAGIKIISEDIPYELAKSKIATISARMNEIQVEQTAASGNDDDNNDNAAKAAAVEQQKKLREEYYVLELEMEKYNNALIIADEHIQQINEAEEKWETSIQSDNQIALRCVRRHMPVNIKYYTEEQLVTEVTPNNQHLSKVIARKFKRCNVLQLLRMDPLSIRNLHPAILENMRVTGMTLTERRAVYCHLTESRPSSLSQIDDNSNDNMTIAELWKKNRKDPMVERKLQWYNMMRDNLKSALSSYEAHVNECGGSDDPTGEHHECKLIGNQCPIRADRNVINYYDNDYGYPDGDVYQEVEEVATVSLSLSSNNGNNSEMIDPKQLSEDRVKEEIRTRTKLAYEEWQRTYEKEYEKFVESVAARKVKITELESQIEQYNQDVHDYNEEYQQLKSQLGGLPKGSSDRLLLMKKVNVSQTKCADANRACVLAGEELDKLKEGLKDEEEFVCSVPKPEWDENEKEDGQKSNGAVSMRSSLPSLSTGGGIEVGGCGREELFDMVSPIQVSRKGTGTWGGDESRRRSSAGGGGGRGGLLAAIQGRGRGGGGGGTLRAARSSSGSDRGGLLAAIQSRGKSERVLTDSAEAEGGEEKPVTSRGFQLKVPNRETFKESSFVPQCQNGSASAAPKKDDTAAPTDIQAGVVSPVKAKEEGAVPATADASNGSTNNGSSSCTREPVQGSIVSSTVSNNGQDYSRKPSTDSVSSESSKTHTFYRKTSSSGAPGSDYKRSQSGGSGVQKTALVDCPPPKENVLHKMKAREEEVLKREQMRKAAEEKAKADAAERAERLKQEKEARLLEEAREKEESERKERERVELLAKQKEEEERNRRLAKEAERERLRKKEEEKAAESDRIKSDKVAELKERVKKAEDEAAEYEEKMQQTKLELKDLPRGSKDRVTKMKEINMYQQKRGEAKKAIEAAEAELQ